jgi:hypothetical protein
MITPKVLKTITSPIHRYRYLLFVLPWAFFSMSCERQTKEIVITNTAEVKRMEVMKAELEMEKEDAKRRTAQDSLRTAEAEKQAAEAKQMEQEAKLAREKLAQEKELEKQKIDRAKNIEEQKKDLENEVTAIASASETINVFAADLRSRQGRLQINLKSLPEEIEQAKTDALYLTKILSSCRQGVVTNIRYSVDGKARIEDVKIVTLKPDEYVKTVKADQKISRILTRYNNELFSFELDKVVEELAYENKRLSTSWEMLQKGKTTYSYKQTKADASVTKSSSELKKEIAKVEQRIKALEFRARALSSGFKSGTTKDEYQQVMNELGVNDGPYPTGLYAEKSVLERMIALSSGTRLQADAASSGIGSNFDLQEKSLRDEYEANVRRAFDNVERTVLHVVIGKKDSLEQELKSTHNDLAAIQLILDAHSKGRLSRNDMLSLHSQYTNSVTESLSSAAKRILK